MKAARVLQFGPPSVITNDDLPRRARPWATAGQAAAGDSVLIHGAAGNVGAYAVQLAKRAGLHVVATAAFADLDYVRALSAETLVDYEKDRFEDFVHLYEYLERNAAAGELTKIFATDVSVAEGQCAHCDLTKRFAEAHLYMRGPGVVARCPVCEHVLLRLVNTRQRVFLDIRGMKYICFGTSQLWSETCRLSDEAPVSRPVTLGRTASRVKQ